jgi:hypothetical protein
MELALNKVGSESPKRKNFTTVSSEGGTWQGEYGERQKEAAIKYEVLLMQNKVSALEI